MNKFTAKRRPDRVGVAQLLDRVKPRTRELFRASRRRRSFPSGSVLFRSGENSSGVYLVHSGAIKLTISAEPTNGLRSRVVHQGEILGLSSSLSERPYEETSRSLSASRVSLVSKRHFMKLMQQDSEFAFRVVRLLCAEIRSLRRYPKKMQPSVLASVV